MTLDNGRGRELGDPTPSPGGSILPTSRSDKSFEDLIEELTDDDELVDIDIDEPHERPTEIDFTKGPE